MKNKDGKRVIAVFLAVVMILTLGLTSAFADDEAQKGSVSENAAAIDSPEATDSEAAELTESVPSSAGDATDSAASEAENGGAPESDEEKPGEAEAAKGQARLPARVSSLTSEPAFYLRRTSGNGKTTYSTLPVYVVDQNGDAIDRSKVTEPSVTSLTSENWESTSSFQPVVDGYEYSTVFADSYGGPDLGSGYIHCYGGWWSGDYYYWEYAYDEDYSGSAAVDELTALVFCYRVKDGKVTLTYDTNGGDAEAPEAVRTYPGETIALSDYTGARSGYTFLGWSTTSDPVSASTTYRKIYSPGEAYTMGSEDATLYAAWQEDESSDSTAYFFIRLDGKIPNEPSSYPSDQYTPGIRIANDITIQNWVVDTSGATPDVGVNYASNGVTARLNALPDDDLIRAVCKASNIAYNQATQYILWYVQKYQGLGQTMYSKDASGRIQTESSSGSGWHIDGVILDRAKVNLSYDPNVPSGVTTRPEVPLGYQVVSGTEVEVGEAGSTTTNDFTKASPSIPGYTFLGWNTKEDGSGTGYQNHDTFALTENTVLYAQWSSTGTSLKLTKTELSGNSIAGAGFTIEEAGGTPVQFTAGTYTNSAIKTNVIYTVTETEAPANYQKLADAFHFIVKSDGASLSAYLCDEKGEQVDAVDHVTFTYSQGTISIKVANESKIVMTGVHTPGGAVKGAAFALLLGMILLIAYTAVKRRNSNLT